MSPWSDFETFIESFITALRDFDRDKRGAPTRKSGHPEARAEAVAAFCLVGFRAGSAIATIEPEAIAAEDEMERMVDAEPIQMTNLCLLISSVEKEEPLPESVVEALEKAVRSAGDDGTLSVEFSAPNHREAASRRPVIIDTARIERIRSAGKTPTPKLVTSISGRLHQVDFEPDKLAIRASDGVDWVCSFPKELGAPGCGPRQQACLVECRGRAPVSSARNYGSSWQSGRLSRECRRGSSRASQSPTRT